jgi:general secretion pathway protein G
MQSTGIRKLLTVRHFRSKWTVSVIHQIWITLVKGTEGQAGKKFRYLRLIPTDPTTNSKERGLRSMQDDPDSDSWGGQNVFDVYTKSEATALDGSKYKDW